MALQLRGIAGTEMHCPYCLQAVTEHALSCSGCGLNLAQADASFGRAPALTVPVSDRAGVFREDEAEAIAGEIGRWSQRFPQVEFLLVTAGPDAGRPLGTYAFWLFNRAVRRGTDRDGRFGVMLLIGAEEGSAVLTVGYALEPFTSREALQEVLAHAEPLLRGHRFAEAVRVVLRELGHHFRNVLESLPRIYGIDPSGTGFHSPA